MTASSRGRDALRSRVARTFWLSLSLAAACSSGPVEPAPLAGGETISYRIDTDGALSFPTFTFEKSAKGFTLRTDVPSFPPQELGPNLLDGRGTVEAFKIGMLWLAPSERKVGARTRLGDVLAEEQHRQRNTFKVSERNGSVLRWFDAQTGFLVHMTVAPNDHISVLLERSTIPGL